MQEARYKAYLLFVLMLAFALSNVDRLALGVLLQAVKLNFDLTDTQLGILGGIAFAFFYSLMGIPIARWADRGNRVTLMTIAMALWSAGVMLCGAAGSFLQLLLVRVGVAVGEAGCMPASQSLIADSFSRAERPRAVGIFMLGGALSVVIGYFGAGWLNEVYGWRTTFVLLGLPGLLFAPLILFSLREPRCESSSDIGPGSAIRPQSVQPGFREACATLWKNRTFRRLLYCLSVMSFFGFGIATWLPPFFIRSYGLHTAQLGAWLAVIYGLGGALGTYVGGALASRAAAHNERVQLKAVALVYCASAIVYALTFASANVYVAFVLLGLGAVGGNTAYGPLFATIQILVPRRICATAVAITYLFSNLIGMGLGPVFAGALSDAFRHLAGNESLRYALFALCPGYLWGGWYVWQASRSVEGDIQRHQSDQEIDTPRDSSSANVLASGPR